MYVLWDYLETQFGNVLLLNIVVENVSYQQLETTNCYISITELISNHHDLIRFGTNSKSRIMMSIKPGPIIICGYKHTKYINN